MSWHINAETGVSAMATLTGLLVLASLNLGLDAGPELRFESGLICESAEQIEAILAKHPQNDDDFSRFANAMNLPNGTPACFYALSKRWYVEVGPAPLDGPLGVYRIRLIGYRDMKGGYEKYSVRLPMYLYRREHTPAVTLP